MTTNLISQESFIITCARKVIDYVDEIKNTQINDSDLHKLTTSSQTLVEACNLKPMKNFPVKIIDEPTDNVEFEMRSTYYSKLKLSEVASFVIGSLKEAENHMDDGQCLDTLCVLINYCNVVIYSRFDCGLSLEPKKIDDWNSSVISTHLEDREDSCIT
jgi:hypothetical protein